MAESSASRVTFLDGHVSASGWLGVLAFPVDYPGDVDFTIFFTAFGNQWMQLQFDFDLVSVTSLVDDARNYRAWWLAGKRGEMVEIRQGVSRIDRIEGAGTSKGGLGYLSQVRSIGGQLFVCGYRRQVYRLQDDGQWALLSGAIIDRRPEGPWNGFESIDGFSPTDLYAAGDEGEVWHFDGVNWVQCDVPTNRTIADVRCIDGVVWLCGDGVVISGDRYGWTLVNGDDSVSENWWSIEKFGDSMFLAGNDVLATVQGQLVNPVRIPGRASISAHRLCAVPGALWSLGEEHLLRFDGANWIETVCPQNR